MTIKQYYDRQKKGVIESFAKNQSGAIDVIRSFIKKHNDKNLFGKTGGVEIFNYMDDNIAICFHDGGTGECEKIYEEKYDPESAAYKFNQQFSEYDVENYSAKAFKLADAEYTRWRSEYFYFWALDTWQKAEVSDQAPFAFHSTYYRNEPFDLKNMCWKESYEHEPNLGNGLKLSEAEIFFKTTEQKYYQVVLKRDDELIEIGFLKEGESKIVFEREYADDKWEFSQKIKTEKDPRELGAEMLRTALEYNFEIIEKDEATNYEQPFPFILPSNISHVKNAWGEAALGAVSEFEEQFSIRLPNDYRAFLQRYNGFQTHGYDGFGYGKYDSVRPIVFYGLTDNKSFDIVSKIEEMRYASLPKYIPIGEDLKKNKIWLGVAVEVRGKVLYKKYESAQNKIVAYEVGHDFQTFINEFFFDTHNGLRHIIEAGDFDAFKKYMKEQWEWDNAVEYGNNTMDYVLRSQRPDFLEYAIENGAGPFRIERNGVSPATIKVFEKHKIKIPKICFSKRLNNFLINDEIPFDKNEFDLLIQKCGDVNLFGTYDRLKKYVERNPTPNRLEKMEAIKPYVKELNDEEKYKLLIDQKGFEFEDIEGVQNDVKNNWKEIETKLGVRFPDEVKYFLTNYHSRKISSPYFSFIFNAGNDRHYDEIKYFYSTADIIRINERTTGYLKERKVTQKYVPFAITKNGGYVMINLEEGDKNYKKIGFLFQHIRRFKKYDDFKPMFFNKWMAADLYSFLMALMSYDDIHDHVSTHAIQGDLDYFKNRVKKGWEINSFTLLEQTALHLAVRNNHHEVAQFLLDNGANPNIKAQVPAWETPLALAMLYVDEKMMGIVYPHSEPGLTNDYEVIKKGMIENFGKEYLKKY